MAGPTMKPTPNTISKSAMSRCKSCECFINIAVPAESAPWTPTPRHARPKMSAGTESPIANRMQPSDTRQSPVTRASARPTRWESAAQPILLRICAAGEAERISPISACDAEKRLAACAGKKGNAIEIATIVLNEAASTTTRACQQGRAAAVYECVSLCVCVFT